MLLRRYGEQGKVFPILPSSLQQKEKKILKEILILPPLFSQQRVVSTVTKNQKFIAGDTKQKEHTGIKEGSNIN